MPAFTAKKIMVLPKNQKINSATANHAPACNKIFFAKKASRIGQCFGPVKTALLCSNRRLRNHLGHPEILSIVFWGVLERFRLGQLGTDLVFAEHIFHIVQVGQWFYAFRV